MGEKISKSRAWAIATVIIVACIVALAVGLALGLREEEKILVINDEGVEVCEKPPTSSRLTKDDAIYVQPTVSKEGAYRFSAVASDSPPCSTIGTKIMARQGGTAVDAAIAAILCAGVYNPQSCGIGGGFFMTFYKKSENKAYAVMAREMAPGASSENMFKDTGKSSLTGGMAIGIPGEIKGLYEAYKLGGRLPWSELFKPAIDMCNKGFTVGQLLRNDIVRTQPFHANYTNLRDLVTKPGSSTLMNVGDIIKQPKLAATLQKIADDPFAFYNGTLADDIVADIHDEGGIITKDDLLAYTAAVKNPVTSTLNNGDKVYSPPPPSSGAVIQLILNILKGFNLNPYSVSSLDRAVDTYHKIIESFKHGFSVRTNLGDEDMETQAFKERLAALLANMTASSSSDFVDYRRSRITTNTHDTDYYEGTYSQTTDAGTSHLSVLDANGDAVAVTSTINTYFGSKVVGSRTGIVFNNEMDDFSTPGKANFWGIAASPANYIKPFKRPLSSMSPSVVTTAGGDVRLVTGASGGSRIVTSTALSIIQTLWLELGVKEAIDYPRVHHQLLPETVRVENRFRNDILDGLARRGHRFEQVSYSGSACQAVLQKGEDSIFANSDHSKYGRPDGI